MNNVILGDIFHDIIKNYLYWVVYDIDTIFGDFNKSDG